MIIIVFFAYTWKFTFVIHNISNLILSSSRSFIV